MSAREREREREREPKRMPNVHRFFFSPSLILSTNFVFFFTICVVFAIFSNFLPIHAWSALEWLLWSVSVGLGWVSLFFFFSLFPLHNFVSLIASFLLPEMWNLPNIPRPNARRECWHCFPVIFFPPFFHIICLFHCVQHRHTVGSLEHLQLFFSGFFQKCVFFLCSKPALFHFFSASFLACEIERGLVGLWRHLFSYLSLSLFFLLCVLLYSLSPLSISHVFYFASLLQNVFFCLRSL